MLHLITCHGRIMPRLAELLFFFCFLSCQSSAWLMIHMKCQDYSLKKIKVKLFSTAVVIGALMIGALSYTFYTLGHFYFGSSSIYQLTLKPPITTAADNSFYYFLLFATENKS